jgi:hypothetical protein
MGSLEKLNIGHWSRNLVYFIHAVGLLSLSQGPVIGSYPEPDEPSHTRKPYFFKISFNIILPLNGLLCCTDEAAYVLEIPRTEFQEILDLGKESCLFSFSIHVVKCLFC